MHVHRFAKTVAVFLGVFALSGASPLHLEAQGSSHAHNDKRESGSDQKRNPGALVAVVREATERYKNVAVAEADGYSLQFGCVTGPDWGAMGLHYVNFPLVLDGELDPAKPEIVIYEPAGNGKVRMIGADFLVLADAWHAKNPGPPELMGQLHAPVRGPEPLRPACLLHAARVGVEGQPRGHVRQLALERLV